MDIEELTLSLLSNSNYKSKNDIAEKQFDPLKMAKIKQHKREIINLWKKFLNNKTPQKLSKNSLMLASELVNSILDDLADKTIYLDEFESDETFFKKKEKPYTFDNIIEKKQIILH